MMDKSLLVVASLAAAVVFASGAIPAASASHFCPGGLVWCSHSPVGAAGVCAISVGCVAWCPGGGFETCGLTDCYRFVTLLDAVQVCANALP